MEKKWFLRSFLKSSFVDFQNIMKKCYFSFSLGSKQYNNVSSHRKLIFFFVSFGHADYLATPFFWTEKFGPRDMARLWCLGPSEKLRPSARVGYQMSAKWRSGQVNKWSKIWSKRIFRSKRKVWPSNPHGQKERYPFLVKKKNFKPVRWEIIRTA